MESCMNAGFSAFVPVRRQAEAATHPLARPDARLSLYPQGVGRIRKAAKAATTPLSLVVAGNSLPPSRFAAATRPDAPSSAPNYRF
jgi:hypothetical protein